MPAKRTFLTAWAVCAVVTVALYWAFQLTAVGTRFPAVAEVLEYVLLAPTILGYFAFFVVALATGSGLLAAVAAATTSTAVVTIAAGLYSFIRTTILAAVRQRNGRR